MRTLLAPLLLACLGLSTTPTLAQEPSKSLYLILDASGSMWGQLDGGRHKISVAKEVLTDFAAGDFGDLELALRVYGHRKEGDCRDSELAIPFAPSSEVRARLTAFLETINPKGKTPIGYSLRQALADFGDRSGDIILVSDGIETCDDDPCALVRQWQQNKVAIRVHVVGLGLDDQSRQAMQCIAKAAGTEYRDADTAVALAESLGEIRDATAVVSDQRAVFRLTGVDPEGNSVRVAGTLSSTQHPAIRVVSHARFYPTPGVYTLEAGVETKNGNLYRPVKQTVEIAASGETRTRVQVELPPSVAAIFKEGEQTQRGSQIEVYQKGEQVFRFRAIDRVFLDEGSYQFRSRPNADNELQVDETFSAGEHKEIVFRMVETVALKIRFLDSMSGQWLRRNTELWQDSKISYKIHSNNGNRAVLPGVYDVRWPGKLTPYVVKGVKVTRDATLEFTIPMGQATIVYQRADGSRDGDKRCFLGLGAVKKGIYKTSGKPIPLMAGTYNVVGWKGNYERVVFEVKAGEAVEVVLRALQD